MQKYLILFFLCGICCTKEPTFPTMNTVQLECEEIQEYQELANLDTITIRDLMDLSSLVESTTREMLEVAENLYQKGQNLQTVGYEKELGKVKEDLIMLTQKIQCNTESMKAKTSVLEECMIKLGQINKTVKKQEVLQNTLIDTEIPLMNYADPSEPVLDLSEGKDFKCILELVKETKKDLVSDGEARRDLQQMKTDKVKRTQSLLKNVKKHISALCLQKMGPGFSRPASKVKSERFEPEATKRILPYSNQFLAQMQNDSSFLLDKIINVFYEKTSQEIEMNKQNIQRRLESLLLYDYSRHKAEYHAKISEFVSLVQNCCQIWSPNNLAKALDKGFLSLLVIDSSLSVQRLEEVLHILHGIYSDKYCEALTLDTFLEYFYDILNVHLLLSVGNSPGAYRMTKFLFCCLRQTVRSFTTQKDIHAVCLLFDEFNRSFYNHGYRNTYDMDKPEYVQRNLNASWKYHLDQYSRIHHCMSVHDTDCSGSGSQLFLRLHPLLSIMEDDNIPMWISGEDNDEYTCTVEFGFTSVQDQTYRTGLMSYDDACRFTTALNINMIIDRDLTDKISTIIQKYTDPDAVVRFIGSSPNSPHVSLFTFRILEALGHIKLTVAEKQNIYESVVEKVLQSRSTLSIVWPLLALVGSSTTLAVLVFEYETFLFTVIPLGVAVIGVFRGILIKTQMETRLIIMAFKILTGALLFILISYFCDVFIRASDLTENLDVVKCVYGVFSSIGITGLLITYSDKMRRRVYGRKYILFNLIKYLYYAMGVICAFAIPFFYVCGFSSALKVAMASNIGLLAGVFFYVGCAYEKMPVRIKSDRWIVKDTVIMVVSCVFTVIGLVLSLLTAVRYNLFNTLPIVIIGKKALFSLFKEKPLGTYGLLADTAIPRPASWSFWKFIDKVLSKAQTVVHKKAENHSNI